MFLDETRVRVSLSPMFLGATPPPYGPMSCCAHSRTKGRFFCSSAVVNRLPLRAQERKDRTAPVRKSYRWLSGFPAQKGRRVKGRVPRRPVNAASLNNALESLAPVPLHPLLTRFQVARRAKVALSVGLQLLPLN